MQIKLDILLGPCYNQENSQRKLDMNRERKPRTCPLQRRKSPEDDDGLLFKNRLKEARAERGLSQDELATLAGVSRQTDHQRD